MKIHTFFVPVYQILYLIIIRVKKDRKYKKRDAYLEDDRIVFITCQSYGTMVYFITSTWLTESSNLLQSSSKILLSYSKY